MKKKKLFPSHVAHEKIEPLTKVETDRLIKERLDSFVRKCGSCDSIVSNAQPFLRWFAEEFCNELCFDEYLKSNNGCVCWNCDSIIGITKLCVHAEYVENNLRLFCSVGCQSNYLKSIKMCEYCHKKMGTPETVAQQANRFCSDECEKEHTRIFNIETDPKAVEAICTDCNEMKQVKAIFVYNGKEFPFCSYSCSFFLKFSCGLFPGEKMNNVHVNVKQPIIIDLFFFVEFFRQMHLVREVFHSQCKQSLHRSL